MKEAKYFKQGGLGESLRAIVVLDHSGGRRFDFGERNSHTTLEKDAVIFTGCGIAHEITKSEFDKLFEQWSNQYAFQIMMPEQKEFVPKIKYLVMLPGYNRIGYSELDSEQFVANLPLMEKGGFRMLDEKGRTKAFINKNLAKHASYNIDIL